METLDWVKLAGVVEPKKNKVSYEENKHLFTKLAFDVFQLNTSPVESLWLLQEGEDGKQYLFAMYNEEEQAKGLEVKSSWTALADKDSKNVTLLYKDTPIQRFASSEFGFDSSDIHVFQRTLVTKLSSDKEFRQKFIQSQPYIRKMELLKQFPELV